MSLSSKYFTIAVKNTDETIDSLVAELNNEKRQPVPNQDRIAEIKQKIRALEVVASHNVNTVNRDFRTNH